MWLELLLEVILIPKVKASSALIDPNTFRKLRFYNRAVEKAFKDGMQDLKKRFQYFSKKIKNCSNSPSNTGSSSKNPISIMTFNQFIHVTKVIEKEDHDFDIQNLQFVLSHLVALSLCAC